MDWETKFSTIVHETEANLDRVRRRLEAARNITEIDLPSVTDFTELKRRFPPAVISSEIDRCRGRPSPILADSNHRMVENLPPSPPIWATVLEEQIHKQKQTIDTLTSTVISLQNDKEKQKSAIEALKDTVTVLQERVEEKGVHLDTESKLSQWKQETRQEINDLKHQVKQYKYSDASHVSSHSSVEGLRLQVTAAKNECRDEAESARKDIEYYKTRMTRLEKNIAGLADGLTDLNRKHNELRSEVASLTHQSRSDYRELSKTLNEKLNDMEITRSQLSVLKADIAEQSHVGGGSAKAPQPSATTPMVKQGRFNREETVSSMRQPAQWREFLSHSLSTMSVDSTDSALISGYLARKRSVDSNSSDAGEPIPGGMTDSSSENTPLQPRSLVSTPSSSPTSLSVNDL